jgi:cation:H+ antiporter
MIVWLQFIACTAIIVYAGAKLSSYGDIIADLTGMGRTWIGVIMLASVTSLPELITGVSSVTLYDAPNIAVGDALGSCMFNMLIIALLDFKRGAAPIFSQAHQGQVLSAAFGVALIGLVSMSIAVGAKMPVIGWFGANSVIFILVYAASMRTVFVYEKRRIAQLMEEIAEVAQSDHISKARAFTMYGVNAALVIGAGTWLPHLGERIAEMTGLGRTFVGSVFIAASTSLPELVVSFAALRIGAVDLALGNLFGSNLFNICILALDDFFYVKGPLLAQITVNHLISASAAIVMTAIAVIGLTYRASRKILFFAWDSLGALIIYALATYFLYITK